MLAQIIGAVGGLYGLNSVLNYNAPKTENYGKLFEYWNANIYSDGGYVGTSTVLTFVGMNTLLNGGFNGVVLSGVLAAGVKYYFEPKYVASFDAFTKANPDVETVSLGDKLNAVTHYKDFYHAVIEPRLPEFISGVKSSASDLDVNTDAGTLVAETTVADHA